MTFTMRIGPFGVWAVNGCSRTRQPAARSSPSKYARARARAAEPGGRGPIATSRPRPLPGPARKPARKAVTVDRMTRKTSPTTASRTTTRSTGEGAGARRPLGAVRANVEGLEEVAVKLGEVEAELAVLRRRPDV